MSEMGFTIVEGGQPPDESPGDVVGDPTDSSGWYDPEYPYSTKENPYGFFNDKDGQPDFSRPRKRRPHNRSGSGSRSTVGRMPASETQARTAAAVLAKANLFIGMGLSVFGLKMTAKMLEDANKEFEVMAYEALLNDPALCRKILSAGVSSGRAQLAMAYALLGGSLAPVAYMEFREARATETVDEEGRNVSDVA